MVVAWRTAAREVWVNRATGWCSPGTSGCDTGELTGWGTPQRILDDVDSADIELAPMYVLTTSCDPTCFPASHAGDVNSELLALFHTSGMGSAAIHRYAYANPSDVLATWTLKDVKTGAFDVVGDVAPGVAVWPARSAAPAADNYRSLGYACGIFPARWDPGPPPPATPAPFREARIYCYLKSANSWEAVADGWEPSDALGRKPSFAFHAWRGAAGSVLDARRGQFWGGQGWSEGGTNINVSELVSESAPPISTVVGAPSTLKFNWIEGTWSTAAATGVSVYADRDISAPKSLGVFLYSDKKHLDLQGIFDGSFHAELKDGNDFKVMEQGICRGLHPHPDTTCCNPWVSGCAGYYNLSL